MDDGPPPRPQVLWLNIPRPEDTLVLFVVFALMVYLLFLTLLGGQLLAILMSLGSTALSCVVIVGLGRISRIIAEHRQASPVSYPA